jgi:hypothetical protein
MKLLTLMTIALTSTLIGCGGAESDSTEYYNGNFDIDSLFPEMTITDSNLPNGDYSFYVEDPMGFCESGASYAASSIFVNDIGIRFTPGPADEDVVNVMRDFYPAASNGRSMTPYNNRRMNTDREIFTTFFSRFYPGTNVKILTSNEITGITTGTRGYAYAGWEIVFEDLRDGINYRASLVLTSKFRENGLIGFLSMGVVSIDLSSNCFFSAGTWAKNEDYIPIEG